MDEQLCVDDMEHASMKSEQSSVALQYGYSRLLHCLATVFVEVYMLKCVIKFLLIRHCASPLSCWLKVWSHLQLFSEFSQEMQSF